MFRSTTARSSPSCKALILIGAIASGLASGSAMAAAAGEAKAVSKAPARADTKRAAKKPAIATGWLSGIVVDEGGNRIEQATIWITLPGGGEIVEQTDWRGRFHIGNLPDSKQTGHIYTVRVAHCEHGEGEAAARVIGGSDASCNVTLKAWPWLNEIGEDASIIGWCPVGPDWSSDPIEGD